MVFVIKSLWSIYTLNSSSKWTKSLLYGVHASVGQIIRSISLLSDVGGHSHESSVSHLLHLSPKTPIHTLSICSFAHTVMFLVVGVV